MYPAPRPALPQLWPAGANIEEVHHQRAFTMLAAQNVEIELVLQTRGHAHVEEVLSTCTPGRPLPKCRRPTRLRPSCQNLTPYCPFGDLHHVASQHQPHPATPSDDPVEAVCAIHPVVLPVVGGIMIFCWR